MRHAQIDYDDQTPPAEGTSGRATTRITWGIDEYWLLAQVTADGRGGIGDYDDCEVEPIYEGTPEPDDDRVNEIIAAAIARNRWDIEWE